MSGASELDLNADVGESYGRWVLGDDESLLGLVTSANVACGFHAGDPATLRRTCELAAASGVVIGAQVSYPDLAGFGRRFMAIPGPQLRDDVLYQLGALQAFARAAGTSVRYVKPHGALYHAVVTDAEQANAVVDAVVEFDSGLAVLGLPGSALLAAAEAAGLVGVPEAFADRAYRPDGGLVPRAEPGAVLDHPAEIAERTVTIARDGRVRAVDGTWVTIAARSVCLHGDTSGAVAIARAVRAALQADGITVRPFVASGAR